MKFDRRLTDEIYTSDTVRLGKKSISGHAGDDLS